MPWYLCEWTFQLKSPLHIGFHKIMHFFRTRPYVPGKLLWGALTAKLTHILGINDYQKVGDFLKKAMRFGYLYPYVEGNLYFPKYTENGLMFNSLSLNDFEKKFISSMASAAIDSESLTAEEGMLHEIEFISPYTIDEGSPVYLKGLLWVRELSEDGIALSKKNKALITAHNGKNVELNKEVFNQFQLGGERKYGFGLVELNGFNQITDKKFDGLPGNWDEKEGEVIMTINSGEPIWAHVLCSDNLNIKGNVEPVVGRDWNASKGAGRSLTSYGLCWSPGSILCEDKTFKVKEIGLWEARG